MKRLRVITIVLLIVFSFGVYATAAESASIGGNVIKCSDEYQLVPISVSNNQGVMGYKISVEYPKEVSVADISRGTLCSSGNFNTNLENHKGNVIDVVWNSSENVNGDGSLFVIKLKADKSSVNKEIKISYSQDDTFNEDWKDVVFNCSSIKIVSENSSVSVTEKEEIISEKDYDNIKNIVEIQLENLGEKALYTVPEDKKSELVESVSNQLTGVKIDGFDDLLKLYNNSIKQLFISEVKLNADDETIENAIKSGLKAINKSNVNDISEKDKKTFDDAVVDNLQGKVNVDKNFNNLSEDEKYETIISLYNQNEGNNSNTVKFCVAVGVLILIVIVSIIVVIRKRRRAINAENVSGVDDDSSFGK